MKTTIDISDAVLEQAKAVALREGISIKALVELGLRKVLAEKQTAAAPFQLRDVSFGGAGLQPALQGAPWEQILDLSYGDRH